MEAMVYYRHRLDGEKEKGGCYGPYGLLVFLRHNGPVERETRSDDEEEDRWLWFIGG